MQIPLLITKIHRATVTEANLDYEGSITIDQDLLRQASIPEFAQVHIYNCSNGHRFETYTIKGEPGSGTVCINGAAAHLTKEDDIIIICFYGLFNQEEAAVHSPTIILVDHQNRVRLIKHQ
ncbi:aspartate 1-decarboxylase [bacterium]|nr:aspartate 1-decarboxylase [bacterium]